MKMLGLVKFDAQNRVEDSEEFDNWKPSHYFSAVL